MTNNIAIEIDPVVDFILGASFGHWIVWFSLALFLGTYKWLTLCVVVQSHTENLHHK